VGAWINPAAEATKSSAAGLLARQEDARMSWNAAGFYSPSEFWPFSSKVTP
jgi:hypothetical protein